MRNFSPLMDAVVADASPAGGGAPAVVMQSPTTAQAPATTTTPATTTIQTPAPWHSDWLKPDGTLNSASYERLPDNLKSVAPSLANAKSADDIMVQIQNLSLLAGKKALAPLPANASPEIIAERNLLLKAINQVPDKAEGYGIVKPTDLPDFAWNQKATDAALAVAMKHNISPAAVKEWAETQAGAVREQMAALKQDEAAFFSAQEKTFLDQLKKDGIPVERANDMVTRAAEKFGMAADDPVLKYASVKLLLQRAAVATMEPRTVTGEVQAQQGGQDFTKMAEDIIHNPKNPEYDAYWNKGPRGGEHPQNKAVKEKVILWQAETARQALAAKGGRR